MDSAFGWLGLLFLLLTGSKARGGDGGSARASSPAPRALPAGGPPPPWPQVVPDGLPAFPGSGWEYDEPPPKVVQQRAGQLVSALWAAGSGTFKIEQTAGRWIAYRAEIVHGGAKGVVAYRQREKRSAAPAAPAPPRAPAVPQRPVAPAPAPREQWSSTSPGLPQRPAAAPPAATPATWDVRTGPATSLPTSSPLHLPTLRKGRGLKPAAPDPDVVLLQQKLGIAADGRFGSGTEAAVRAFQVRNRLDVDGVVGAQTWTALFAVRA